MDTIVRPKQVIYWTDFMTRSRWKSILSFPTKILYAFLIAPIRAACPSYLILLDLINLIMFCEEYKVQGPCNVMFSIPSYFPLGPNILLSSLFSKTVYSLLLR